MSSETEPKSRLGRLYERRTEAREAVAKEVGWLVINASGAVYWGAVERHGFMTALSVAIVAWETYGITHNTMLYREINQSIQPLESREALLGEDYTPEPHAPQVFDQDSPDYA